MGVGVGVGRQGALWTAAAARGGQHIESGQHGTEPPPPSQAPRRSQLPSLASTTAQPNAQKTPRPSKAPQRSQLLTQVAVQESGLVGQRSIQLHLRLLLKQGQESRTGRVWLSKAATRCGVRVGTSTGECVPSARVAVVQQTTTPSRPSRTAHWHSQLALRTAALPLGPHQHTKPSTHAHHANWALTSRCASASPAAAQAGSCSHTGAIPTHHAQHTCTQQPGRSP